MNSNPPILVTGAPRSGASMIAGVLNICGAFGGVMDRHCENIAIRDRVTAPYLLSVGADPAGQYPLPATKALGIPPNWSEKVLEAMGGDGYTVGPWMYKSSRLSLTWPVWHYAFPNARWIIVRRRTGDIIQSCTKTDFMRAFRQVENQAAVGVTSEIDGWKWFVHQYQDRWVEMIMEGLNCKVVWPERMVYGDYEQIFETVDWLGLKWKTEALAWIDPKFFKARRAMAPRIVEEHVRAGG